MPFTHQDLCSLAVNWLQRAPGRSGPACQVAFSEAKGGWNGEIPDAIGFRTAAEDEGSVVVEVKVSRSDYLADRAKAHRQDGAAGMGLYRYFMVPEGIIAVHEMPPRWGLVEVTPKGILRVLSGHVTVKRAEQPAWRHERAISREWLLLASMLSRVGNVEAMHTELKRVKNEQARLARELDALRARERANMLSRAVAGIDTAQPLIARRKAA
ncbi:adenylosuccinate synthase [Janthinobacterium sp. UMAB-56]|uniref:adenylosuccinate synthase n=1 Tax=Janthinobacterium sp. UMAB-56 TaxID=1365361 RepID=UPI001C57657D|nr:adenylosuccinate synthase [Janthinobacterium sp. UMAB-56]